MYTYLNSECVLQILGFNLIMKKELNYKLKKKLLKILDKYDYTNNLKLLRIKHIIIKLIYYIRRLNK